MASGQLLKDLFRSYKKQNLDEFDVVARQIIEEEKRKNHNLLAKDLERILNNGISAVAPESNMYAFEKLPRDKERDTLLLEIRTPGMLLSDIVLSENLLRQIKIVIDEFYATDILRAYGLNPRRNLLLAGPPGCGKTLCAEVLAGELGLPMLYTRFDAVISSYLGETAANLRKVFEFARRGRWVVFFDEFDAIGKSRDDLEEHGELKRVVNTFLQLLDSFQSDSLFIAATNHEFLLDRALWRRFDDILYFDKPTSKQIPLLIDLKLKSFIYDSLEVDKYINSLVGWTYSDIERACIEAMKIAVMEQKNEITNEEFEQGVFRQSQRVQAAIAFSSKDSST